MKKFSDQNDNEVVKHDMITSIHATLQLASSQRIPTNIVVVLMEQIDTTVLSEPKHMVFDQKKLLL